MSPISRWLVRIWVGLSVIWIVFVAALMALLQRDDIMSGDPAAIIAALILALGPPAFLLLVVAGPIVLLRQELGLNKPYTTPHRNAVLLSPRQTLSELGAHASGDRPHAGRAGSASFFLAILLIAVGMALFVHFSVCEGREATLCATHFWSPLYRLLEPIWPPVRPYAAFFVLVGPGLLALALAQQVIRRGLNKSD